MINDNIAEMDVIVLGWVTVKNDHLCLQPIAGLE
jgi:hypothetical protein